MNGLAMMRSIEPTVRTAIKSGHRDPGDDR
jgi:hypothetical protein